MTAARRCRISASDAKPGAALRIIIVSLNYSPEPTGIAPYSTGLAEGLARRGHDVRVITGIPHYPEWRNYTGVHALRSTSVINGVTVTRLRHYIPAGGTGVPRAVLEASFAAAVAATPWGDPDVVIAVSPSLASAAVAGFRARLRRAIPFIVWVQDLYGRGVMELKGEPGRVAETARRLEAHVVRPASGVVVIHKRFGKFVSDEFDVSSERVHEIRNWSHVRLDHELNDSAAVRERYGWGTRPVVLHCGNMGAKQGLDAVISCARQAEAERRDVLFVLMGDGSQRPHLKTLARGCANLQMLPPLPKDEFNEALQAADILLLNEKHGVREMALPSKLTTYFSAGKPVIAAIADDGTSADELRAAEAGVIVAPGDADAMLSAIDDLLTQPDVAAELGQSGKRYALGTLSFDGVLAKWEGLLQMVTHESRTLSGGHERSRRTAVVDPDSLSLDASQQVTTHESANALT